MQRFPSFCDAACRGLSTLRALGARRGITACAGILAVLAATAGCTEVYILFGPGGPWGPQSTGASLAAPQAGGAGTTIANPGSAIPTTTQPAAVTPPAYGVSLLDPLLEQTAGAAVVVAADLNSDGLMDFASGSRQSQPVQIHLRNPANLEYTTHSVAGGGPIARMADLAVADFDADGNPDIAVLVNDSGFVPVPGAETRGAVVIVFAPADPSDALSWQTVNLTAPFVLPEDGTSMTDFAIADFDGVNGPDIALISNEVNNNRNIYLYPNPGAGLARNGAAWNQAQIEADAVVGAMVEAIDIDGDGDIDLVAAFPSAITFNLRWLRNPLVESGLAAVTAGPWERRFIGQQEGGADFIAVGDVDGDGDADVAAASIALGLVQWFENPGPGTVQVQDFPWSVFNILATTSNVVINQVRLVDLNLDGRMDCFVTASGNMIGAQPGAELRDYWTPFTILSTSPVATIGTPAFFDVNNDNRLDIIAPLDRDGLTRDQIVVFTRQSP